MLPTIVSDQVESAKAESANLRSTASEFPSMPAVAARLNQAAHTIDVLVSLLEIATFSAKINHDTIAARRRHERTNAV